MILSPSNCVIAPVERLVRQAVAEAVEKARKLGFLEEGRDQVKRPNTSYALCTDLPGDAITLQVHVRAAFSVPAVELYLTVSHTFSNAMR